MLRRGELLLWGQAGKARGEEEEEAGVPWGSPHPKDLGGGGGRRRRSWGWPPRRRRGRPPGSFRPPPPFPPRPGPSPRCCSRPRRPRVLLSLRPANFGGRRGCSEGMRAPCNTNQFLMGEKYRLMHLRSDSVGEEDEEEDCGGGGGEVDPCCLDMDAYLGALENARGALLDGRETAAAAASSAPRPGLPLEEEEEGENSLPYFPSEDDLLQSQSFMERDFQQFCSTIA